MTAESNIELFRKIYQPHYIRARDRVERNGRRFVYYTTASTAFRILQNREIWMRSTLTMNDFTEVKHGANCVIRAYESEPGKLLNQELDRCFSGISSGIHRQFRNWIPGFDGDTFITCVSEHVPDDDAHGRLSMWRAYGGSAGVALVLNGDVIFRESDALAAYSSPVEYLAEQRVGMEIRELAERIGANREVIQALGKETLQNSVFHALRYAVICTKHPAFLEEREWRIISSPSIQASDLLTSSVEVIHGVPQTVLKIKLEDHPDKGLHGLAPPALLNRVLVGPCEHPEVIARALRTTLRDLGVENYMDKVVITAVPLRLNQS